MSPRECSPKDNGLSEARPEAPPMTQLLSTLSYIEYMVQDPVFAPKEKARHIRQLLERREQQHSPLNVATDVPEPLRQAVMQLLSNHPPGNDETQCSVPNERQKKRSFSEMQHISDTAATTAQPRTQNPRSIDVGVLEESTRPYYLAEQQKRREKWEARQRRDTSVGSTPAPHPRAHRTQQQSDKMSPKEESQTNMSIPSYGANSSLPIRQEQTATAVTIPISPSRTEDMRLPQETLSQAFMVALNNMSLEQCQKLIGLLEKRRDKLLAARQQQESPTSSLGPPSPQTLPFSQVISPGETPTKDSSH